GAVSVVQGYLNLEDSQAAGLASAPVPNTITVNPNFATAPFPTAALELQLQGDNIAGMITSPKPDSMTGTVNKMTFSNALTINGYGIGNTGALHSISGINIWSVGINLGGVLTGTGPSIGVD